MSSKLTKPPKLIDENQLLTYSIGFKHPHNFQPASFMIIGVDPQGRCFVNAPFDNPGLVLHLLGNLTSSVTDHVKRELQPKNPQEEESRIIQPSMIVPTGRA